MKFTAKVLTSSRIHKTWSCRNRTGGRIGTNIFKKMHGIYQCENVMDLPSLINHPQVVVEGFGTYIAAPVTATLKPAPVKTEPGERLKSTRSYGPEIEKPYTLPDTTKKSESGVTAANKQPKKAD